MRPGQQRSGRCRALCGRGGHNHRPPRAVPAQCAALSVRARIIATRINAGEPDLLYSGRDAADAALRLAVRHQLAWHELDALRAHVLLDQTEGTDRGWAAKADA